MLAVGYEVTSDSFRSFARLTVQLSGSVLWSVGLKRRTVRGPLTVQATLLFAWLQRPGTRKLRNDWLFGAVHQNEKIRRHAPKHANDFIKRKFATFVCSNHCCLFSYNNISFIFIFNRSSAHHLPQEISGRGHQGRFPECFRDAEDLGD